MTAPGPDPACRRGRDEGWTDLVRFLTDLPGAAARVGRFEPVRRGSARPIDPDRPTAPIGARPLGVPSPAGPPVPDEPLIVGVRVVGTRPAGLGDRWSPLDVVSVVRAFREVLGDFGAPFAILVHAAVVGLVGRKDRRAA